LSQADDDTLRQKIAGLLAPQGLQTQTEPVPESNIEFNQILNDLRALPADALEDKLIMAGFTDQPYGEDGYRCLECMYYLTHRRWCDLPELNLPVQPQWWCRLWRI
jgi:hypothetical protein